MTIKRGASAHWTGSGKEGQGTITTDSKTLSDTAYSFGKRFGSDAGTNPEELIAAAHASCFTMATAFAIGKAGFTPEALDTKATVGMEQVPDGFSITTVHLEMTAKVPGMSEAQFLEAANGAKAGCPVSKVLNATITLDAKLV